jgi:hypothetical protein
MFKYVMAVATGCIIGTVISCVSQEKQEQQQQTELQMESVTLTVEIKDVVNLPADKHGCKIEKVAKATCIVCGSEYDCNYFSPKDNE